MTISRRHFVAGSLAFTGLAISGHRSAEARGVFFEARGKAIRGYDTVAYFKAGKPVKGRNQFQTDWNGTTWLFSSEENLQAFKSSPNRFAPQYGGYCAWAMVNGDIASIVPEAWDIVDGKLYLNFSLGVRRRWRRDIPRHIRLADGRWPRVRQSL
ncbi:MAG: YHS domain-containing (seleno)protein [Pseudomonadota bacterium]